MSLMANYISEAVVTSKGIGSPDSIVFPYSLSSPGTTELQQNALNDGQIQYTKVQDGEYNIEVTSAFGGNIAVFSEQTIEIT